MAFDLAQILTITSMTALSYASTNVDNLLLGVVLLGANRDQQGPIKLGMVSAAVAVMLLCAIGLVVRHTVDAGLVGYLGLLPIALGLRHLWLGFVGGNATYGETTSFAGRGAVAIWLGTAALMMANSGDTVALFLPLLADTRPAVFPLVALAYLGTAIAWALLAWALASRPWVARTMDRYGARLLPWVMIGVGLYILANTATDNLA